MDVNLGETDARTLTDEAKLLQDAGDWAGAADRFLRAYNLEQNAFRAGRYLHCIRKQGALHAQEAARWAKATNGEWSADPWFQREYVWSIYDGYLKSRSESEAEDEGDTNTDDEGYIRQVQAAERFLELTSEQLPVVRTIFAVCKAARERQKWQDVLRFAARLDGEALSRTGGVFAGRKQVPDHERWLTLIVRATYEVGNYGEALRLADEGAQAYPGNMGFARIAALARIALGETEAGLESLEQINRRFPPQWYLHTDIARALVKLGREEEALRWFCEAAAAPGDLDGRITIIGEIADILQRQGRAALARDHLLLAWAVAARAGWKGRVEKEAQRFTRFAANNGESMPPVTPTVAISERPCRAFWRATVQAAAPRTVGEVVRWNGEKGFGFIRLESGEEIYFRSRDFRGRGREPLPGMSVEFTVRDSYDVKKDRESKMAVHVIPVS